MRLEVEAFRKPILTALNKVGGRGRPVQLLPLIEEQLQDRLTSIDYEELSTGGPRWEKTAHWTRFALVEGGYIDGSDYGWWTITDRGKNALEKGTV